MKIEMISKGPESNSRPTPVLFVHGMWHAAWCWSDKFQPYFADHGYRSHAMSLRGHGASDGQEKIKMTPLNDFVSDLAQVIEKLDSSPILVGHSMGGMIVQKYLENHQVPAAILLGSAPPKGLLAATMRIALKHPLNFLKVNLTFNLKHNISKPEHYKELFFSENFADEELARYYEIVRVQEESMMAYLDMMFMNLPQPEKVNTPILVLGTLDDNLISVSEVKETAKAFNTEAMFFSGIGHAMMLDNDWQKVADKILGWLIENDL